MFIAGNDLSGRSGESDFKLSLLEWVNSVDDVNCLEIYGFSKNVGHIDSGGFSKSGLVVLLCLEEVEVTRDGGWREKVFDGGVSESDYFNPVVWIDYADGDESLSFDSVYSAVAEFVIVFSEHRAIVPVKDRGESEFVGYFENYFVDSSRGRVHL